MKKLARPIRIKVYAIYDLTNGEVGVHVPESTIREHIERSGLEGMTEAALDEYIFAVIRRIQQAENKEACEQLRAPVRPEFPSDYEPCGDCGFDHAYEQGDAHEWHLRQ